MDRATMDQRRSMARHLVEIQRGTEDCRAGLAFLGQVFKECGDMTLNDQAAQGLGHILHSLVADIEGIEGDLDKLEQYFHGGEGEQPIDLDRVGGRVPAKN
jgi:hypothetical protein